MKIKVRTKDFRFFLPIPTGMIGFITKCIPQRAFQEMRSNTPEPYCDLVTKENVRMMVKECLDIFKENKGLEIVHVEASDGTFVSIKL